MIIKEMYTPPAAACGSVPWDRLRPTTQGAAVMIRDSQASQDGWFWGWVGWTSDWQPDWPNRAATNAYPFSGFGQYCTNCHSSAANNQTFSTLKNIAGEPGDPLVYLTQRFFLDSSWQGQHSRIAQSAMDSTPLSGRQINPGFARTYSKKLGRLSQRSIVRMPSETYDNVWAKGGPLTVASQYLTSDQCLGCHSAGGTGLQFDMTEPGTGRQAHQQLALRHLEGLADGSRRPRSVLFRPACERDRDLPSDGCQHRSRIPASAATASWASDKPRSTRRLATGSCGTFSRTHSRCHPLSGGRSGQPAGELRSARARRRVMHRMPPHGARHRTLSPSMAQEPQNACVLERQEALNPGLTGFAKSFTGSFLIGPPDKLYGPFQDPKKVPMQRAIGSDPAHSTHMTTSEVCGSCHTVHLPVLHRGKTIGHTYEQATYPEWAFSDYRTGTTPDGPLPLGRGARAQSCQDCHMPSKSADGSPHRSKIASIQEYTNFPQTEHTLPPAEIDLPVRSGVSKHTLVGLNIFLVKMAQQFADILGLRPGDPMLGDIGINPTAHAEAAILEQAEHQTAAIKVDEVKVENAALNARVTVTNKAGHKFPSGVAFRRAFIEFQVLDETGSVLWASGRTDSQGVIVDAKGTPIPGEFWWTPDCSARIAPNARIHQPHYQVISREDQAQIYEELISAPADVAAPVCGPAPSRAAA